MGLPTWDFQDAVPSSDQEDKFHKMERHGVNHGGEVSGDCKRNVWYALCVCTVSSCNPIRSLRLNMVQDSVEMASNMGVQFHQ